MNVAEPLGRSTWGGVFCAIVSRRWENRIIIEMAAACCQGKSSEREREDDVKKHDLVCLKIWRMNVVII